MVLQAGRCSEKTPIEAWPAIVGSVSRFILSFFTNYLQLNTLESALAYLLFALGIVLPQCLMQIMKKRMLFRSFMAF